MTWKRRGGRKVIIAPDGGDAWAPAKPRPDETLIRALARAHRWKRMLEEGRYRSAAEIAEAEGVTRSFVNRLLRLTLLAPDIVEAILDGRQPKGMQLEELTGAMPSEWEKQRAILLLEAIRTCQDDARGSRTNVCGPARLCYTRQLFSNIIAITGFVIHTARILICDEATERIVNTLCALPA